MSGNWFLRSLVMMTVLFWPAVTSLGQVAGQETESPQTAEQNEVRRAGEQTNSDQEGQPSSEAGREQGQSRRRGSGVGGRRATAGGRRSTTPSQSAQSTPPAGPETKQTLPQDWADQTPWRSIGPSAMSGRVIALAVSPKDSTTWWGATASGGLLKTTNNGITFEHQFDKETTVSIGDVQVAASNPEILWVGTGEHNPRNSTSWGDGVYKSTDGGKTWTNMGLKESFQIGRIAIHPENPDIVWVGALGRLWGPSKERGLFKTIDGGKTWKKVLYVNQDTGIIDVKLNPKNPNEMLVAAYERRRGEFDINDPIVRFGKGSGVYRSTDGGESFTKVTQGLPSCKLGRIGFDYYLADPKYVIAVVESEKVGMVPEKWAFLGVRGENADVGARLTAVTNESPAAKAGLKVGDIIVLVDGELATDYPAVLALVRKKQAGDKLKLVVTRERKKMEMEVELVAAPAGQAGMNPFVGELGGQAANLQDQQGETGEEHGGLYLSEDGGASWNRVNTLNPRPMYFSHVRFDPSNRDNIYVCGVSLFRSFDGGKTFQGDGGRDTHADNQALWINPTNGRHMILATDGGIYMTYDRMEHWDHLNHVAIGQFYHVGIDTRLDYNVYGGLQDNGSWGGPSRGKYGEGSVNTDWFRVGSGDGFVTLVDPEDPDQIYYESQNGFMARVNLKTGERGSAQPRERGQRFRFNWKTPFILSPHNTRTHYSVGNFVFKSTKKGTSARRISPEITNSDEGSGSAISESPLEEGVIYAGTTDGAVWLTRDGGKDWQPLFYQPRQKPKAGEAAKPEGKTNEGANEGADAQPSPSDAPKAAAPAMADAKPETPPAPAEAAKQAAQPDDGVSGLWKGTIDQEGVTDGAFEFTIELKKDDKNVITGTVESPMGELPISSGVYVPEKREIELNVQTDEVSFVITGQINQDQLKGKTEIGNSEMVIEFVATRIKPDPAKPDPAKPDPAKPVGVTQAETENRPAEAQKSEPKTADEPAAEAKAELKEEPKVEPQESVKPQAQAETQPAVPADPQAETPDDPVSGKWSGTFSSERGEQDVTLSMRMNAANEVTGSFESTRGEREFAGKFDPAKKSLTLNVDSEQVQLTLEGKVENERFVGDLDFNAGQFSMTFDFKRDSKLPPLESPVEGATPQAAVPAASATSPAAATTQGPSGEKSLLRLLPGPRWVSSIEASRFKPGRCYITFDGHRSDDDGIYVFVTNDYGQTWESLKANLPATAGSVHVLREDIRNENLLYLGCEFSAWFSIDAGKSWTQIKGKFPTVAVHDFAIHPTAGEIVAATHGRSLWIADVGNLRQFSPASIAADATLYQPKDVILWRSMPSRGDGLRRFVGENPYRGARIAYSLGKNANSVSLVIKNIRGEVVKTMTAPSTAGLHTVEWPLDLERRGGSGGPGRRGGPPGAGATGGGGFQFGPRAAAGEYLVVLEVDGKQESRTISIKNDPAAN